MSATRAGPQTPEALSQNDGDYVYEDSALDDSQSGRFSDAGPDINPNRVSLPQGLPIQLASFLLLMITARFNLSNRVLRVSVFCLFGFILELGTKAICLYIIMFVWV